MKRILVLWSLLLFAPLLWAQDDPVSKTVEVVRAYDAVLPEVYKINLAPRINDSAKLLQKFTYAIKAVKPLTDNYFLTPIPPARVQRDQLDDPAKFQSYLRLGLGYKLSTLLDLYIGGNTSKISTSDFGWIVYANHYGSFGNVRNSAKEDVKAPDIRNDIGFALNKSYQDYKIAFNAGYAPRFTHYYGYNVDSFKLADYEKMSDTLSQHYLKAYTTFSFASKNNPETWAYGVALDAYDFRAKNERAEDALRLNLFADKQLLEALKVGASIDLDMYFRSKALAKNNLTRFAFAPYGQYQTEWWVASAKLDLTVESSEKTRTLFFPTLNYTLLLLDGEFLPYAEIAGKYLPNSFETLASENPYLTPVDTLDLRTTNQKVGFALGAKGRFRSWLSYNFWVDYAFIDDIAFFYNTEAALGNYFDVAYDNGKLLSINGQAGLRLSKAFDLHLTYRYQDYEMDKLAHPLHRPQHYFVAQGRYNLWNKLTFSADAHVRGSYYALDFSGEEGYVEHIASCDLSAGVEYRFFNSSSAFLYLNNLLASRYQVFHNYDNYGFNVMLGYTYKF